VAESETLAGELLAVVAIVSVLADTAPRLVGVTAIARLQLEPTASVLPLTHCAGVLTSEYWLLPETPIAPIVIAAAPAFFRLTVRLALSWFSATFPKFTLFDETVV